MLDRVIIVRRYGFFIFLMYRDWVTYQISHPHVSTEKPFSKTYALVFGIKMLEKF
jgi:hypothetical protein